MAGMEEELLAIQQRNVRVEADKAWEVSFTRRASIAVCTYLIVGLYLTFLGVEHAWLHACVPTGGFILSTLSLRLIKKFWLNRLYKGARP